MPRLPTSIEEITRIRLADEIECIVPLKLLNYLPDEIKFERPQGICISAKHKLELGFPIKLYWFVEEHSDLVTWAPDGRSFNFVQKTKKKREEIAQMWHDDFFSKSNEWGSFLRSLNQHGFNLKHVEAPRDYYMHKCGPFGAKVSTDITIADHPEVESFFIRDHPELLSRITTNTNILPYVPQRENTNISDISDEELLNDIASLFDEYIPVCQSAHNSAFAASHRANHKAHVTLPSSTIPSLNTSPPLLANSPYRPVTPLTASYDLEANNAFMDSSSHNADEDGGVDEMVMDTDSSYYSPTQRKSAKRSETATPSSHNTDNSTVLESYFLPLTLNCDRNSVSQLDFSMTTDAESSINENTSPITNWENRQVISTPRSSLRKRSSSSSQSWRYNRSDSETSCLTESMDDECNPVSVVHSFVNISNHDDNTRNNTPKSPFGKICLIPDTFPNYGYNLSRCSSLSYIHEDVCDSSMDLQDS